jgi:hypothetical protein
MSLPLSPVEVGQQWYARNRLGLNTLICHVWGEGVAKFNSELEVDWQPVEGKPARLNYVVLTRVMEKPALLSVELLRKVVQDVFAPSIRSGSLDCINIIADNGPHFKAYRLLDYVCLDLPDKRRVSGTVTYGLPYHMKSICDATGGKLTFFREQWRLCFPSLCPAMLWNHA